MQTQPELPALPPLARDMTSSMSGQMLPWMAAGFLLMIIAAVGVFHQKGKGLPNGQELPKGESIFQAVNAATLTGFELPLPVRDYTPIGRATLLILTAAGSIMYLSVGGWAVNRIARLGYSDAAIVITAFACVLGAGVIGLAGLQGHRGDPLAGTAQAMCAFGNSGLQFAPTPDFTQSVTHLIILPLAVLGGLGLPVLMETAQFLIGSRKLSEHSLIVLSMTGLIFLIGLALLLLLHGLQGHGWTAAGPYTHGGESLGGIRQSILSSSAMALDARTLGAPIAFPISTTSAAAAVQWILIPLMLIGASSGGTGGGLKTTTLWHLITGLRDTLRGRAPSGAFGLAALWLLVYLALAAITLLLLNVCVPELRNQEGLFLTLSAISNVGLSHETVSLQADGYGILTFAMLAGRLTPLGFLWWMSRHPRGSEIAVG